MLWFRWLFHYSFFAALCAAALSFQTAQLLRLPYNPWVYLFVFAATLCSYNMHWLTGRLFLRHSTPGSAVLWQKSRGYLLVITLGLALLVYSLFHLPLLFRPLLPAMLGTALYSLPLLPFRFLQPLRKAGFVKTLLLAATWSYVTGYLPVAYGGGDTAWPFSVYIIKRFCLMLQLCLIFDLRDTRIDQERGLHSLTTDISQRSVKIIYYVTALAFLVCSALLANALSSLPLLLSFILMGAAALLFFRAAQQERGYWFYYLGVDGLMIFSALLSFLAEI